MLKFSSKTKNWNLMNWLKLATCLCLSQSRIWIPSAISCCRFVLNCLRWGVLVLLILVELLSITVKSVYLILHEDDVFHCRHKTHNILCFHDATAVIYLISITNINLKSKTLTVLPKRLSFNYSNGQLRQIPDKLS